MIREKFEKLGFSIWQTGGGCQIFGLNLPGKSNHTLGVSNGDGIDLPELCAECLVEVRNGDGEDIAAQLCSSIDEAVRLVTTIKDIFTALTKG